MKKNEINIQNFFEIKNLTKKYVIQILPRNDFNNVLNALNINIKDYIRGNTNYSKREIDILELEDQRKTIAHKNANLDEMEKMIIHEIVHAYNNEFNYPKKETLWFREGVATNLSKQDYKIVDLKQCEFDKLVNDFNNYSNSYSYSYTIVNYLLKNYEHEKILDLIRDDYKLIKESNKIFYEVRNNQ